jgi:selenocysteine lyase/cysteine desulfurase
LNASLRYLEGIGIANIAAHADPLVCEVDKALRDYGVTPMCAWNSANPSGILAFQHTRCGEIHAVLEREHIHVMHHAGRIRIAIHGYNTHKDVVNLLSVLEPLSRTV